MEGLRDPHTTDRPAHIAHCFAVQPSQVGMPNAAQLK